MNELAIVKEFIKAGMTPAGACAMGGNIQAESGFKANIAQRGMTKLSDEEYTAKADRREIDFANDAVGYGLCQWTYPTRKISLWNYAYIMGKSVGDEQTQVEFCIAELQNDYPALWRYLCQTQDLSGAAGRICTEYERPAVNNIAVRAQYANGLFMRYGEELMRNAESGIRNEETKPLDFAMPTIKRGDRSPEALYLAARLAALGYDVLWDGLTNCLVNCQQRMGLEVSGLCDEKTWNILTERK